MTYVKNTSRSKHLWCHCPNILQIVVFWQNTSRTEAHNWQYNRLTATSCFSLINASGCHYYAPPFSSFTFFFLYHLETSNHISIDFYVHMYSNYHIIKSNLCMQTKSKWLTPRFTYFHVCVFLPFACVRRSVLGHLMPHWVEHKLNWQTEFLLSILTKEIRNKKKNSSPVPTSFAVLPRLAKVAASV